MNFYMASVALLWTTARRARAPERLEELDASERVRESCSDQERGGSAAGRACSRPLQGTLEARDQ